MPVTKQKGHLNNKILTFLLDFIFLNINLLILKVLHSTERTADSSTY